MTERPTASASRCNHAPLLVVLTGPSGVGKDAVLSSLADRGVKFHRAVTATTRMPRAQEQDGRDYRFVSEGEFLAMLHRGDLLEYARVYGYYYGVPKAPVRQALARGEDVLVRTDVQGATTIKTTVPQAVTIFIAPASLDELKLRLLERRTESEETLSRRLAEAEQEMKRASAFDYTVVNRQGRLDETVEQVESILMRERCDPTREPIHL